MKGFRGFRESVNKRILDQGNLQVNRLFTLDTKADEDGALDARTKEIAGLAASLVLRCDPLVPSWQEHREKYEMKIRRWKLEY